MVVLGKLSPDPSNEPEENDLSTQGTNLMMPVLTSSDSEEEDLSHEGYEMLPQDYNENSTHQHDENEDDEVSDDINNASVPDSQRISNFEQALRSEATQLWSSPDNSRLSNIVMDSAKEEQVKNAMAGFSLPPSSIPLWARDIPEEEWKQQLIQRINSTNKT